MNLHVLEDKDYEYDEAKRSYFVDNPLKSLELKTWPDILLAVCSIPFLLSFGAMFADSTKNFAIPITLLVSGIMCFGLGGKLAHYRYRDSSVKGNMNAWFSGWKHSLMADGLAALGLALIGLGIYKVFGI